VTVFTSVYKVGETVEQTSSLWCLCRSRSSDCWSFLEPNQESNRRARPYNHTFVADFFWKAWRFLYHDEAHNSSSTDKKTGHYSPQQGRHSDTCR